jgi:alpha-L-rhamnosidase
MLGNGWYNPLPLRLFRRFNLRDVQQTGRPCVKAQLLLRFTDGTEQWVTTGNHWRTAPGPVVRNNVYLGEQYDARKESPGWSTPSFAAAGWKQAAVVEGPSGALVPRLQPPVRVTAVDKPVKIWEKGKDTFIVDMGVNGSGVARIRVKGPAGRRIGLRYGEDIHPDGSLNWYTTTAGQIKEMFRLDGGPGAPKNAWQEDGYTLSGRGLETWHPRFTYHGFRYVEITGWPGTPTAADIEALRFHTDLPQTGSFACSNESFNRLDEVVRRTFLSNVHSVQTDCPGREKMGYGADIVVTSEAYMYNYDMAQFYRKTVQDFANEQQPDGGITEIAPYTGIADRGYGGHSGPLGWQLAYPYLIEQLYTFYGDRRIIEQQYDGLVRQMAFLEAKAMQGTFHWDISDHEALDPRPEAFSAASFHYHHALLAACFAGILRRTEDSVRFATVARNVRQLIRQKYAVPGTGRFDNGTQSAQLFSLWYGFAPNADSAFYQLTQEVERHKGHVSTGIFSTKFLFDVLRLRGQPELAYRMVNQKDFPGWLYMLDKGATTLWETWAYPANAPSQNHPMFGSVSEWFYRSLLGINTLAPGFTRIQIKPQPAGDLTWARGGYTSVQGWIGSEWKRSPDGFELQVVVPANTRAEIWIPHAAGTTVTEGGKALDQVPELKPLRQENGYTVVETGGGKYVFRVGK